MIKLIELTDKNCVQLNFQTIICYEKSESYLKELALQFPSIYNNIFAVIDDYKRNQGQFTLDGRTIDVFGSEVLNHVDFEGSALIITSDYYKEAFDKLCNNDIIAKNTKVIYYFANQETQYEEKYREFYKNDAVKDIIVFRSGPHASSYVKGMDFSDNARALFEYMLEKCYNERYELVWLVKNPEEFKQYLKYKNVYFLSFDWSVSQKKQERAEYYRVLCQAKYFFFTDAYGFVRNCREDQIRVQLWHGCGFKTRVNFVRCEKRYEYTTVISDLYARIHADIYGLRDEQILVTGYAKQDWLFHPVKKNVLNKVGIKEAGKYVFWLPTFRTTEKKLSQLNEYSLNSDTGLPILNNDLKLQQLNDILVQNDMVLVIKLHPFQDKKNIDCKNYKNIVLLDNDLLVKEDVHINQLLGWADALISDYSSAAVDYMLLDRPIAFTLEDVEAYEASRGFVFENIKEWMPGKELLDYNDFIDFMNEIALQKDTTRQKRNELKEKMHKYSDDKSCKRIIEILDI